MRTEHIAEDGRGDLWFATWDNGVSRFDGDQFQSYGRGDGLCGDRVFSILRDGRDRLWFATLSGVCWYDGRRFHHPGGDGMAGRQVQFLFEDDRSRLWCAGTGTLGYFQGDQFHDLVPRYVERYGEPPSPRWTHQCWGIVQDAGGDLWFAFDHLVRYDGRSFYRYGERDGLPPDASCYAVGQDPSGCLWIGRAGDRGRIWRWDGGSFEPVAVDLPGNLRKIQTDRDGRLWLCTSGGALYQSGDGFDRVTTGDGLPYPVVNAVYQDPDRQHWFATWGGGVALYDAFGVGLFERAEEYPEGEAEISRMVQDRRGRIWIGFSSPFLSLTARSVARFDGSGYEFVGAGQGLDLNSCFAIYEDDGGDLWLGGGNGLFRYDGARFERIGAEAGFAEAGVSAVAQDRAGRLLVGQWVNGTTARREELFASPLQIVRRQGERFVTVFREEAKEDPFNHIGALVATRDGELWYALGTHNPFGRGKGIGRWHPERGATLYTTGDGLPDNRVVDLLEDRSGHLWIATQNGLGRFDGHRFQSYTTEDGLPSNRIRCLFEDGRGHLWLGTDGGVVHHDGRLFQTIKLPQMGPVLQILEDREGTFWFATALGTLVRYRPRRNPPRVRLVQVVADRVFESPAAVVLSAGRPVMFEYKGVSFSTHPREMLYVVRLEGHEAEWRPATRRMRAYYRDLPKGEYTFRVRAVDRDLNYSAVAEVSVSVEPDPRIAALTAALGGDGSGVEFTGRSAALQQVQTRLMEAAEADLTVLILGETGVGKGLAARALHALGGRRDGPLIHVNCGAMPATLVDSELFGHEKGSFTTALARRLGKVELAAGGTLFLDEIGDMPLEAQVKLLRFLEDGTFERLGGSRTLGSDARVVAATNRDLEQMVRDGDFREDLYYRLQVLPIRLPPLRDRKEDIPALAELFMERMASHLDKRIGPLTPEVLAVLQAQPWPGNVRELEHTLQRAVIACRGPRIMVGDLGLKAAPPPSGDLEILPLEEFERRYIRRVLESRNWHVRGEGGAAEALGLPPSTLRSRMKKLGLERPR